MSAKLPVFPDSEYPPDIELKLLQIVHRHGERTPVRRRLEKLFPPVWNMCDANKAMFATITKLDKDNHMKLEHVPTQRLIETETKENPSNALPLGSCYYGQLTNLGRDRMTLLGESIREQYIHKLHFLPDMFTEENVYIRSSEFIRAQESVQQLITAVYPENKRNDHFILKLRIRDPRDDNMFPNPNCYKLRNLSRQFQKTVADMMKDELKSISERLKPYVKEVSLDSHPSANGILDTVISAKVHGLKVPSDIDNKLLEDLERVVVNEWFYGSMISSEVRRLGMGRLMGVIRDRMVHRAEGTENEENGKLKLALYSGHDTTVAPLLIIMDTFDKRWPPFGSAILFELFKQRESDEHYVRVKYNNKSLALPGCQNKGDHKEGDGTLCTLDAFSRIVKDQVPDDWEKECTL